MTAYLQVDHTMWQLHMTANMKVQTTQGQPDRKKHQLVCILLATIQRCSKSLYSRRNCSRQNMADYLTIWLLSLVILQLLYTPEPFTNYKIYGTASQYAIEWYSPAIDPINN